MQLSTLIEHLRDMHPDTVLKFGFGEPASYRGSYDELAFAPLPAARVGDMLTHAEGALGQTFVGYKGGDFTMGEWTPTHICKYGSSGDGTQISDALVAYWMEEDETQSP
jgi:hypothetical protein